MELTPCCNADFLRVQSVAHNPRIRISTDSSLPLSSIISFLTKKWKPRSILEAESAAEVRNSFNLFHLISLFLILELIHSRMNLSCE
jgi:hypothetical protein